jgi:hypothetical protein
MTRMRFVALFVIAAALLGKTEISDAQSAYSYPWCALGGTRDNNALSCYYTSWEQCRTTMSGIGGICLESPYYHAQPTQPAHRSFAKPHHRRQARVTEQSIPSRLE